MLEMNKRIELMYQIPVAQMLCDNSTPKCNRTSNATGFPEDPPDL
jgi:hypothetical protein